MSDISVPVTQPPNEHEEATRLVLFAWLWQLLLSVAGLGATAYLFGQLGEPEGNPLVMGLLLFVGLMTIMSMISVPFLYQRRHRGRMIALIVNYLLFVLLFVYTLHTLGVFLSIDNLADTFGPALPFLALVGIGFLLRGRSEQLDFLAFILIVIFALYSLFVMGILPAMQTLVQRIFADNLSLGLTVATLLLGVSTWAWWHANTARAFHASIADTEMLSGYLLLSPNLIGFLIFFAGPLIFSFYVSLTEWSAFGDKEWVALGNYQTILSLDLATLENPTQRASEVLTARYVELTRFELFGRDWVLGAKDKLFWLALRNTFMFCLMVLPLSVVPALFLANILNSKIPGMRIFRALYFIPSVAAVVGVAVIWNWLYNSTVGFINYGISNLIILLNSIPGFALTDPQVRWLSSSNTALIAIAIMSAWRIVGFNTVLFLAGLQGIPREIYEAAEVDGAGIWRKFRSITVPLLAPTTFFVVTTTIIQALQVFDEVFVLMNPPAGPNNSTLTAVLYLYQNGFQRFNLGYASAVAWTLFIIIFIVTFIQFRIQKEEQ